MLNCLSIKDSALKSLSQRMQKIAQEIEPCKVIADIGCDHGYIAKYALDALICEKAVITDISEKSLEKAVKLLADYKEKGKVSAYCTDGLIGVKERCDTAVIAGMGGMEIISVLKNAEYLPTHLILQPMKNSPQLRQALVDDYYLQKDFLFYSQGKYYNLIVAQKGSDSLTPHEILFGRTNLKSASDDFKQFILKEEQSVLHYMAKTDTKSKAELEIRLKTLKEVKKLIDI